MTTIEIIKRYNSAEMAYIDATLLRDNEIDCAVDGATVAATLPYLQSEVTLSVRQEDAAKARTLLGIEN